MPRFFFHVNNGRPRPDGTGVDLPDRAAARAEAIRAAGEMLRDLGGTFPGEEWRMHVADESGASIITLRFHASETES